MRRPALAVVCTALALSLTALPDAGAAAPQTPARAATANTAVQQIAAAARPDQNTAGVGDWSVRALDDGRYEVSWTSPDPLPLNSDRPTIVGGDDLLVNATTLAADGRTVSAVVAAAQAPEPDDLDVVLSGDRLDEAGDDLTAGAPSTQRPASPPRTTPLDAPDPGKAGPYATTTSDYDLPGVKLPGMKEPIEMVGHVVEPAASAQTGPRPLVLFLHGRHGSCYDPNNPDAYTDVWPCRGRFKEVPSQLGYDYIQKVLASQGYATVSIRVNGINAQDYRLDDGGADARAQIVRKHLDHWTTLAAGHQVDLDRVVLVGHSRGGEGVDHASAEIPLSAPYRIAGQVLLAPTDFANHSAPYIPTATVLPYCDGDVSDIQGQRFTDTNRDVAADDNSLKSSVLVMGANHNYFNTEWTPGTAVAPAFDDWGGKATEPCGRRTPERLTKAEQRDVGKAYVAGAVKLFTGDDAYLPLFDGTATTVPSVGDADVRTHAIGGGRDIRRPGVDATLTAATGGALASMCSGRATYRARSDKLCGNGFQAIVPHWPYVGEATTTRKFFQMSWSKAGAVGGLALKKSLDLSADRLELRTIVDPAGPVDLSVRLTDGSGAQVTIDPVGGQRLAPLLNAGYATKLWAQSLIVDATGATGIDLADIRSIELIGRSAKGRIWVADAAAAPATLADVPTTRAPQINLGSLRVEEGDPPGSQPVTRTAEIPFTVTGEITRPARFGVLVASARGAGAKQRLTVDLAPGQTSGTIPVSYEADRVFDQPLPQMVTAWPIRRIATDAYLGRLNVIDDDPMPTVKVEATRSVREGKAIRVTLRYSAALGYDAYVNLGITRGPRPYLRGNDVGKRWLKRVGASKGCQKLPLVKCGVGDYAMMKAGRKVVRFTIPTRADRRREGVERVTFRYDPGLTRKARGKVTVAVRDR
ncbi:hypothetical protein [Nocardioides sp. GXZ039]|uniref:hypothetical protein n=1 Tax=Nocardioides sp. GXZ039 TaxID=3136018 RepID=UPI0030F3A7B9